MSIPIHHHLFLLILPPWMRLEFAAPGLGHGLGPGGLHRAGGMWMCPVFPPALLQSHGHTGPPGDNQGQTQEQVPAPPSPGAGTLEAPCVPFAPSSFPRVFGAVREEEGGEQRLLCAFHGRPRAGLGAPLHPAAGVPGLGAGPKSTHSSRIVGAGSSPWGEARASARVRALLRIPAGCKGEDAGPLLACPSPRCLHSG